MIQFQLFWFIDCQNKFYILLHLSDNNCLVGRERKKNLNHFTQNTFERRSMMMIMMMREKKSIKKLGGKKMNEFTATVFFSSVINNYSFVYFEKLNKCVCVCVCFGQHFTSNKLIDWQSIPGNNNNNKKICLYIIWSSWCFFYF